MVDTQKGTQNVHMRKRSSPVRRYALTPLHVNRYLGQGDRNRNLIIKAGLHLRFVNHGFYSDDMNARTNDNELAQVVLSGTETCFEIIVRDAHAFNFNFIKCMDLR